jgi:two-component system NarL family response regulator
MTQSPKIKVLIAHGDPLIAAGLAVTLQTQRDFDAFVCGPASKVSSATASGLPPADVVVADYDSGMRLMVSAGPGSHRVVILTHSDSEAKICHALEQGARGYLLLGCSLSELLDALRSVRVGGTAIGPLVASRVAEWMKHRALTRREEDILRQLMLGLSNKRIAIQLSVAVGTVKTHVKSILDKLDAASRTEAVAIAQRRGLLQEERQCPPPESSVARISAHSSVKESIGDSKWSHLRQRPGNSNVITSRAASSQPKNSAPQWVQPNPY